MKCNAGDRYMNSKERTANRKMMREIQKRKELCPYKSFAEIIKEIAEDQKNSGLAKEKDDDQP